ncbi:MAG: hypothetical protein ACRCZ4_07465, partial [Plesiomonas sp.]|uniref:hypothetical protein n=1 Tax=Plesiomonas sp. TaxID=2486279 RepID=UPI003F312242
KLGRELFYNGNLLSTKGLKKIKIVETANIHEEELKILQEESHKNIEEINRSNHGMVILSMGYGYDESDIVSSGRDVTLEHINCAPGSGTLTSHLLEFLKHPWIVRIFAGIIFLAVAAYIGLR